jgi:hypothetical protein
MTARVLVVVDANVKLLEARLTADYFEVRTARSGRDLRQRARRRRGAARRDDARHGRFRRLPQAQGRDAHPAHSGDHGHRSISPPTG